MGSILALHLHRWAFDLTDEHRGESRWRKCPGNVLRGKGVRWKLHKKFRGGREIHAMKTYPFPRTFFLLPPPRPYPAKAPASTVKCDIIRETIEWGNRPETNEIWDFIGTVTITTVDIINFADIAVVRTTSIAMYSYAARE